MVQQSFYGINKSNFVKNNGSIEIYAVINPNSNIKNFLPMAGTEPLTPIVADQSILKYVVFGEKLFKTYIRISQDFPNSIANAQSIFDVIKPTSAKEDVDLLTREILDINKSKTQGVSLGNLGKAA